MMQQKGSVLVVDDHFAVRQSLAIALATAGWRVETAESGSDAFEKLANKKVRRAAHGSLDAGRRRR